MSKTTTPVESGPKRFTLTRPYEFRGTRYDHFIAREPKVRDLRQFIRNADADPILAIEQALSDLVQVDLPVIGEMGTFDFFEMKAWFEGFLSPKTSEYNA